jgi:hypothetical protein
MNRFFTTVIFATLFPIISIAQDTSFPSGLSCLYCKPKEAVLGSVRTLLAVEKRDEYPFDTTVETYSAQGRKVESLIHSSSREVHSGQIVRLDSKIIFVYDSKGRLIKEMNYSLDKPSQGWDVITYSYDSNGRLIEETLLNGSVTPSIKTTFTYEPSQRTVIAMTTSYVEGRVIGPEKAVLIYNDKGQWVKRTILGANGSPNGISEFTYNEKGNLAKETRYEGDGKYSLAHVFTYKYDSNGNWYERHEMSTYIDKEGKVVEEPDWMVLYRVITYHENK